MASTVRELAQVARALSDETRIRMLKLLLENDIGLCEMVEVLPMSHSQVSRNLKALMRAGFLRRWREGKCVVYVADRGSSSSHCRALLDVLAASFNDSETVLRDRQRLQQVIAEQVRKKHGQ